MHPDGLTLSAIGLPLMLKFVADVFDADPALRRLPKILAERALYTLLVLQVHAAARGCCQPRQPRVSGDI